MKFGALKDYGHTCTTYSFIWIIILFEEALKYGDGAKFWRNVGTSAEAVCVEFCN
jgi:hypothetical protein